MISVLVLVGSSQFLCDVGQSLMLSLQSQILFTSTQCTFPENLVVVIDKHQEHRNKSFKCFALPAPWKLDSDVFCKWKCILNTTTKHFVLQTVGSIIVLTHNKKRSLQTAEPSQFWAFCPYQSKDLIALIPLHSSFHMVNFKVIKWVSIQIKG